MNETAIKEWLSLPESTKRNIFLEISKKMNLPAAAIEKDWWVVRTIELVFNGSRRQIHLFTYLKKDIPFRTFRKA